MRVTNQGRRGAWRKIRHPKSSYANWVKIPSDVHTPADAAEVLKMRGG
jgi:hypothetical protein